MAIQTSLQSRIISRTALASLLAVLVAGVCGEHYIDATLSHEINRRAATLSRLLGDFIKEDHGHGHIPHVLQSLRTETDIASLRIIKNGNPPIIVASFHENDAAQPLDKVVTPHQAQTIGRALGSMEIISLTEHGGRHLLYSPMLVTSSSGATETYVVALELDTVALYQRIDHDLIIIISGVAVLFIGTLGYAFHILNKHIFSPIRSIETTMRQHAEGDETARSPTTFEGELGAVAKALNSLLDGINAHNDIYEAQNIKMQAYAAQLEGKTLELDMARQTAERATGLKSEFLANMSHEIRTPLNSVIGMNSLLLETPLADQQKQYAKIALSSAEGLLVIINDILDFSKIESGRLQLENVTFDLPKLVDTVLSSFQAKAADKRIELLSTHLAPLPNYVAGDPVRIRQILTNLIDNAIKFTSVGYVKLFSQIIEPADTTQDTIVLRFSVKDTGTGIPAAALAHIFDKFTQADTSTTRKFGGTGLGLAICRQLAEMMGGEVGVDSTVGEGSVFWFTVRLLISDSSKAETEVLPAKTDISLTDRTLLLVEDNDVNRFFATELLKRYGCQILYASNGVEAVKMFQDHASDLSLILMDCQMPEMDGFEATQRIRNMEREQGRPHTPIIALTAMAMKGDKERCLAVGMDDYLSKPLRKNELHDKLSAWLGGACAQTPTPKADNPTLTKLAVPSQRLLDPATIDEAREFTGEKFQTILQMFLNDTEKHIAVICNDHANPYQRHEVRRAAHSMKSSCLHLGALHLSQLAAEIEDYFAPGGETTSTAEHITGSISNLESVFRDTQKAFADHLHPSPHEP